MNAQSQEHQAAHATTATYLKVFVLLAVITAIEFGIVYMHGIGSILFPVLLVLSAFKFFMVASVFMHLKFDSRLLTWFFMVGIVLAGMYVLLVRLLVSRV